MQWGLQGNGHKNVGCPCIVCFVEELLLLSSPLCFVLILSFLLLISTESPLYAASKFYECCEELTEEVASVKVDVSCTILNNFLLRRLLNVNETSSERKISSLKITCKETYTLPVGLKHL